uniref:DNA ligase (NAD(+)) n=1 Tax=viral metagenome TaxID=1070528 RepID=A0A6C0EJ59_9ZZZZ
MKKQFLNWNLIKTNPYKYAKSASQTTLETTIKLASKKYYNATAILSDEQFDILYSYLEEHYINSKLLGNIGVDVESKVKTKLPILLPSMDKIKPDTKALGNWQKDFKGPYTISDKLDGMSLLVVSKNGKNTAYTRGNGSVGQDISWIIDYINIGGLDNAMVRGELVVSKKNWKIIQTAYPKYSNPRNFVSGYTGRGKIDPKLMEYIDFVVYEYINIDLTPMKFNDQIVKLQTLNLTVVFSTPASVVTNTSLSIVLEKRRTESNYDIDGIILTDNGLYERPTGKYPCYAKAFKMVLDDQTAEVSVLNIKWEPSMYGVLNPVIQIHPVLLEGVTIKNVSGYNARFITNNTVGGLIGPGAIIKITRSGGVIPKVISVVKPYLGSTKACLPNTALFDFGWNQTKVDVELLNPDLNDVVNIKRIYHFFNTLGISYFKIGMVTKIFNKGYNTIDKIISIQETDLLKIDGIKTTLSNKIYKAINDSYNKSTVSDLMAGYYCFGNGFGKRRIEPILKAVPTILTDTIDKEVLLAKIVELPGYQEKTVNKFLEGLVLFKDFYKTLPKQKPGKKKFVIKKKLISNKFINRVFCCTGFRADPILKSYIQSNGGLFEETVKSNVTDLIVKSSTAILTVKVKTAVEKGITISYLDGFMI